MSEKKIPPEDAQKIKKLEKQVAQSRQSLEELRHEKLFSEKVLDSLPGIFYLYNDSGDILRWNKNHETLTGFSSEELRHRKILEWFDGAEKEYIAARIQEVFTKGENARGGAFNHQEWGKNSLLFYRHAHDCQWPEISFGDGSGY